MKQCRFYICLTGTNSRLYTNIRHSGIDLPIDFHSAGINAINRKKLLRSRHKVRSRHADRSSKCIAMNNFTAHKIRISKQPVGCLDLPFGKLSADPCAADHFAILTDLGKHTELIAIF